MFRKNTGILHRITKKCNYAHDKTDSLAPVPMHSDAVWGESPANPGSLAFSKTDFSFQSLNGDTSFITSTDKKPVGNVTVGSGKTVNLKANKEIQIKNGFIVESGVDFEMDISN